MNTIIFGCSVTNKLTDGDYDYYLYSRIDGYAVIMKAKTDGTEYLFRVILQSEVIDTVWASATTNTYLRPDKMTAQARKYLAQKMKNFSNLSARDIS